MPLISYAAPKLVPHPLRFVPNLLEAVRPRGMRALMLNYKCSLPGLRYGEFLLRMYRVNVPVYCYESLHKPSQQNDYIWHIQVGVYTYASFLDGCCGHPISKKKTIRNVFTLVEVVTQGQIQGGPGQLVLPPL